MKPNTRNIQSSFSFCTEMKIYQKYIYRLSYVKSNYELCFYLFKNNQEKNDKKLCRVSILNLHVQRVGSWGSEADNDDLRNGYREPEAPNNIKVSKVNVATS